MAEILTKQATLYAAGKKVIQQQDYGRVRDCVATLPTAYASLAVNDTISTGIVIPAGSRLLPNSFVSNAAGAGTWDIGIRDNVSKVAIDATAVATGVDVATAGVKAANNGTKIAAGIDYVTSVETEVYITQKGAASTANQAAQLFLAYMGA